MKKRLFWLFVIDLKKDNAFKTKKALSQITEKGYQLDSLFIFESESTCKDINEILKNISEDYQFFLIDMTDNVTEDAFKAVLRPRIYKHAAELANVIKEYRQAITPFNNQSTQEIIDQILDKISSSGIDSLTQEEKKLLEKYTKS